MSNPNIWLDWDCVFLFFSNDQTDTYANLDSDGSTDISDDFAQYMTDAAAKEEAEREDAERALAQKYAATSYHCPNQLDLMIMNILYFWFVIFCLDQFLCGP